MIELNKLFSLYRYQVMWHRRSAGMWIVFLLALSLAAGVIIEPYLFSPGAHVPVTGVAQSVSSLSSFVILLLALFLASDAVSREFQSRTAYFILPTPVSRTTLLTAKFLGTYIVSGLILLAYFGVGAGYMLAAYHTVPWRYFVSMLFAYLYLASMLAFTYMFSAVFDSGAAVATLIFIIAAFGGVLIVMIEELTGIEPWFWIGYGAAIITLVYSGNYIGDYPHITHGVMGGVSYNPYIWEGVAIMLGYFILSFLAAAFIFERREVK